jgi:putative SOS response-associated peptidase YedK
MITQALRYDSRVCGRFTLTVSARVLAELFDVDDIPDLDPRYNIAPTQSVLAARHHDELGREVLKLRWGLIPPWADDFRIGNRMINARGETVAEKRSFQKAFRRRRCLIAADGFYEWRKIDGRKQPYLIRFSDRRPFAFGGLWERWHDPDGFPVDSCTIITTTPNQVAGQVHDRMPLILRPDLFDEWLEPEPLSTDRRLALVAPCSAEGMEAFPVGTRVNSPANDDADCIAPIL